MEDACGVSPSLPPPRRRELFTQADLFCFGVEISLFFFFPLSPPFSSLPIRLKSLEKPSRAVRNKAQLWSWTQVSAWAASSQEHPPQPRLFPGAGQPQISP